MEQLFFAYMFRNRSIMRFRQPLVIKVLVIILALCLFLDSKLFKI